jgi:hypothetical protein
MILAAWASHPRIGVGRRLLEIIDELDIKPRLLHPTGQVPQHPALCLRDPPVEPGVHPQGLPIPKGTPKFVMDQVETLAAHMPPMVYCKMENIVSPTGARGRGLADQRGRHAQGDAGAQPRVHLPPAAGRRQDGREDMGAQIMGLGAFTKVVGDAGITVARRARLPITTGNSYSASGALWAAADAMRRMGLVKRARRGPTRDGQDHGHWCHRLHRLGQRTAAGHGLRRGGACRARHEEAGGAQGLHPDRTRPRPMWCARPTTTACWARWT